MNSSHNLYHHCADFSIIIIFSQILGGGGGGGESQFPPPLYETLLGIAALLALILYVLPLNKLESLYM